MKPSNKNSKSTQPLTQKSTGMRQALNIMLGTLAIGLLLIGAIWIYLSYFGYGNFLFVLAPQPIVVWGLLAFAYTVLGVIYLVSQIKHKKPVSKLHIIGLIAVFLIGLIPNIGAIRLTGGLINKAIQPIIETIEYNNAGGPTEEQKAAIKIGNFEDAQALIDGCNVSSILYWLYDYKGPYDMKNTYIVIQARNNGTIDFGLAPDNVNLPVTDKAKLKEAIKSYSDGPYPACQKAIEWKDRVIKL